MTLNNPTAGQTVTAVNQSALDAVLSLFSELDGTGILEHTASVNVEKEYDIEKLNPRKNPYAKRVKKQITINIDGDTIDFFKAKSEKCGIPYQTLINLYLSDCKEQNRELELKWN